jgi:hypothetical protein
MATIGQFVNSIVELMTVIVELISSLLSAIVSEISVKGIIDAIYSIVYLVIELLSPIVGHLDSLINAGVSIIDVIAGAISPLIEWVVILFAAIVNIMMGPSRGALGNFYNTLAGNLMVIIGGTEGKSGITYLLRGMVEKTNPELVEGLVIAVFDLLAYIVEIVVRFMQALPGTLA